MSDNYTVPWLTANSWLNAAIRLSGHRELIFRVIQNTTWLAGCKSWLCMVVRLSLAPRHAVWMLHRRGSAPQGL